MSVASISEATPRSPGPRLSTQELQRPRITSHVSKRKTLRAREVLHTRTAHARPAVTIEARHVATVFRELAGERGSRSVPTPATTMRVPSTKRVIEAAVATANSETGAGNRLGVTAPGRVAHSSQQTPGHATGHGRVAVTAFRCPPP
jgi:hypothetical protein